MKKTVRSALALFLALALLVAGAATALAVQPRFTGIYDMYSALQISSTGRATCEGSATLRKGYTADVTVELKRDGTVIKTWTGSGSEEPYAGGIYYVTSGHEYVVTTTVEVYNASGTLVNNPSQDSQTSTY